MAHTFIPSGPDVPDCIHCGLPRANRQHRVPMAAPASPARALTSTRVALGLDARRTSVAAAGRALIGAGTARHGVLTALAAADPARGMTDPELFEALAGRWPANTVRPRRVELLAAVPPLAEEVPGVERGGCQAWRPTVAGLAALGVAAA